MVSMVNNLLGDWINQQLNTLGWSQRKLAKKAGLSHASISYVISGVQKPGWDFCTAISKPLGVNPVELFVMAGLLPGASKAEAAAMVRETGAGYRVEATGWTDLEEIMDVVQQLDELERQYVFDFARWRLKEQGRRLDSSGNLWLSFEQLFELFADLNPAEKQRLVGLLYGDAGDSVSPGEGPPASDPGSDKKDRRAGRDLGLQ